jgi:hypothetical protein
MHTITAEFSNMYEVPIPQIFVKADSTGNIFNNFVNVFGTARLFNTQDVIGSPLQLQISGGEACASLSKVTGRALSLCKPIIILSQILVIHSFWQALLVPFLPLQYP